MSVDSLCIFQCIKIQLIGCHRKILRQATKWGTWGNWQGSYWSVDECMPLSPTSGVDVEVVCALLEVGVLPAMVTPIVDPAVGFSMSPATYPVPPVPMVSFVNRFCWRWLLLLAWQWGIWTTPFFVCVASSTGCWSAIWFGSYGSGVTLECASLPLGLSADSSLLPAHLTPSRMVEGVVIPESVLSSPAEGTDVAGGSPKVSRLVPVGAL